MKTKNSHVPFLKNRVDSLISREKQKSVINSTQYEPHFSIHLTVAT